MLQIQKRKRLFWILLSHFLFTCFLQRRVPPCIEITQPYHPVPLTSCYYQTTVLSDVLCSHLCCFNLRIYNRCLWCKIWNASFVLGSDIKPCKQGEGSRVTLSSSTFSLWETFLVNSVHVIVTGSYVFVLKVTAYGTWLFSLRWRQRNSQPLSAFT